MVRKCSVKGCKSNYLSQRAVQQPKFITVYSFPKDSRQLAQWVDSLPFKIDAHKITDNYGVCAKHFPADTPMTRRGSRWVPAVPPSIFPNSCPDPSSVPTLASVGTGQPRKVNRTTTVGVTAEKCSRDASAEAGTSTTISSNEMSQFDEGNGKVSQPSLTVDPTHQTEHARTMLILPKNRDRQLYTQNQPSNNMIRTLCHSQVITMLRNRKPNPNARAYRKYSDQLLAAALTAVSERITLRKAYYLQNSEYLLEQ
ncbi:hypothetical protein ElyMa_003216100 [Elysia marginata]|uniref:THAP-type domain-containing protein n=1 Tax=Elysia marginata TaxID=1093978 RepID=A0AAV4J2I3_9GAST|nr:hypothetical protein ElyMa_003216100 [Elysia marginata]